MFMINIFTYMYIYKIQKYYKIYVCIMYKYTLYYMSVWGRCNYVIYIYVCRYNYIIILFILIMYVFLSMI